MGIPMEQLVESLLYFGANLRFLMAKVREQVAMLAGRKRAASNFGNRLPKRRG